MAHGDLLLAAISGRRGMAARGWSCQPRECSQSRSGGASWSPSSGGCPVIRGPSPRPEQLMSMTGSCGWHATQRWGLGEVVTVEVQPDNGEILALL